VSAALAGAVAVTAAVFFVLWPLFVAPRTASRDVSRGPPAGEQAGRALAEIEFDRATGVLETSDYERLKAVYSARALDESRDAGLPPAPAGTGGEDAAEALIATARRGGPVCAACGAVCPEPDAAFCSTCGSRLAGSRG
jgi:hypothetical protein